MPHPFPFPLFSALLCYLLQELVLEKESRIRESMLMMGLKQWILWASWYLKQFLFLFITVIIFTILLKVYMYYHNLIFFASWCVYESHMSVCAIQMCIMHSQAFVHACTCVFFYSKCDNETNTTPHTFQIAIFPNSDFLLLLIFFIVFILSIISFCFFVR